MTRQEKVEPPRRVLIASGNPLFGKGLEKMVRQRWRNPLPEIRMTTKTSETLEVMESWQPDLVMVDHDDVHIDRAEFLRSFVSGEQPMQVMLVSLQSNGAVVVYDRRALTSTQAEDWLRAPVPPQPAALPAMTERSSSMKHFMIAGILILVVSVIVYLVLNTIGLLPEPASTQAGPIDNLFRAEFAVIAFLFSLITVMMVYSIIVFRKREGQSESGKFFKSSSRLEIFWTLVPLVTVLYFSFLGSRGLAETRAVDPQALTVEVTGGQWFWSYYYPDFGVTTKDLYLPVNRQVLLEMRAQDVIHSFWVPEFRVKQDLLPGEEFMRELRITPNKTGTYDVLCAEMCGLQHAYMVSKVIVQEQHEFDEWVNQQKQVAAADPAQRGQQWAQNTGCLSCHSIDGTEKVGPSWQGLYGSERVLEDGSALVVDDEYLYTAIVDPNVHIPQGYPPNVMPENYEDILSDEEINDLIEYIETLR